MQGLTTQGILYAVMVGVAIALIDVCYFFALRHGSVVASQVFWTVGGMLALAIFATLFLKETMTVTKILGVIFGILSVLFITRPS